MHYRVTAPAGIQGGQLVSVDVLGAHVNVIVPEGVSCGDTFLFTLTEEQLAAAQQEQQLKKKVVIGTAPSKTPMIFHDYTDLGMALCLGFAIGISIVFGFIGGVLFVTEPLSAAAV